MTTSTAVDGRYVAVIGGTEVSSSVAADAEEVGRLLAEAGVIVVTGGREGVATAASRGAMEAGGLTVGILPGRDRDEANPWVRVAVPTGLGEMRNALVVMDADAVIAFPGAYGTLTEIAFNLATLYAFRTIVFCSPPFVEGDRTEIIAPSYPVICDSPALSGGGW